MADDPHDFDYDEVEENQYLGYGDKFVYHSGKGDKEIIAAARIVGDPNEAGAPIQIRRIFYKGSKVKLEEGDLIHADPNEIFDL